MAFSLNLTQNVIIEYLQTLKSKRLSFLKYIKKTFQPELIYYPACGGDKLPKEVFGEYHVIHLSLPEDEPIRGYLESLGNGIKLLGHMEHSNLADESVDVIWVRCSGISLNSTIASDFNRVLKSNGIIVVESNGYTLANRNKWNKYFD